MENGSALKGTYLAEKPWSELVELWRRASWRIVSSAGRRCFCGGESGEAVEALIGRK